MAIDTSMNDAAPAEAPPVSNVADIVEAARAQLHAARAALDAEIHGYPTPISGCDAQFNHLLAERQRVLAALRALDTQVRIPTPRAP